MKRFFLSVLLPILFAGCDLVSEGGISGPSHVCSVYVPDTINEVQIIASFTDQDESQVPQGSLGYDEDMSSLAERLSGNIFVDEKTGLTYPNHLLYNFNGLLESPIHKSSYENLFLIFRAKMTTSKCLVYCDSSWRGTDLNYNGVEDYEINTTLYPGLTTEKIDNLYQHIVEGKIDFVSRRIDVLYIFYYVGLKQVRIKADKELWGIKAGEDVSDKFRILMMQDLMLSYPEFEIMRECNEIAAENLSELQGTVQKGSLCVKMKEIPAEKYDQITFTIEMDFQWIDGKEQTVSNSVTATFEN